jgi:23S rRNA (uracil1939-C5)-methyltransferase
MDRWLDERVGEVAGMRILDLYSGVGARAIRWAAQGASVVACEMQPGASAAGRKAALAAGVELEHRCGRVEALISHLLPADLVVVNPPRAGLDRRVATELASARCGRLAYVSCDPATLARDVARLATGWRVLELQTFDAFPQTAHVETIAWLAPSEHLQEGMDRHV